MSATETNRPLNPHYDRNSSLPLKEYATQDREWLEGYLADVVLEEGTHLGLPALWGLFPNTGDRYAGRPEVRTLIAMRGDGDGWAEEHGFEWAVGGVWKRPLTEGDHRWPSRAYRAALFGPLTDAARRCAVEWLASALTSWTSRTPE